MPINVATGNVHLEYRSTPIPGKVALFWERRYSGGLLNSPTGFLGPGRTCRYNAALIRHADRFEFVTPAGGLEVIPDLEGAVEQGRTVRHLGAFLEIFLQGDRYIVQSRNVESGEVWRYCFARGPRAKVLPLASIEDLSGQGLDLERDKAGRLLVVRQRLEKRALNSPADFLAHALRLGVSAAVATAANRASGGGERPGQEDTGCG